MSAVSSHRAFSSVMSSTSTSLSRLGVPRGIGTSRGRTPRAWASRRTRGSFARPSTGGAARRTRRTPWRQPSTVSWRHPDTEPERNPNRSSRCHAAHPHTIARWQDRAGLSALWPPSSPSSSPACPPRLPRLPRSVGRPAPRPRAKGEPHQPILSGVGNGGGRAAGGKTGSEPSPVPRVRLRPCPPSPHWSDQFPDALSDALSCARPRTAVHGHGAVQVPIERP